MIRQILRSTVGHALGHRASASRPGGPDLKTVPPADADLKSLPWIDPGPGPWTVENSYAYCEDFSKHHHESFPVASRFVPGDLRKHMVAVYTFARASDDFADEPAYQGRREDALDAWEEHLERCCHGEATHPVFVALADTIEKRNLPVLALQEFLSAFRVDMRIKRYASFSALRGYTAGSAESVGRILMSLFGYSDPELIRFADEISTALQLTNFWQDIAADAARGHIYLPAEDLHFFGVSENDLLGPAVPPAAVRDLVRFQVARTRMIYERGRPLLHRVGSDLRLELTVVWLLGMALLDKIEGANFDVFSQRVTIRRRDHARVLARAARDWTLDFELSSLRKLWR